MTAMKEIRKSGKYSLFKGERKASGSFYVKDNSGRVSRPFPTGTKNYLKKLDEEEFHSRAEILLNQ